MQSSDGLRQVSEDLQAARGLFAEQRPLDAMPLVDRCISNAADLLAQGTEPGSPLLAQYYFGRLLSKFAAVGNNFQGPSAEKRDVVQVLILDSSRTQVLLQKRGPYKRQFAGCDCVTANAKHAADESIAAAATRAVKSEVGIDLDPDRFEQVGPENHESHLTSFNFYACSPAEEPKLQDAAGQLKKSNYRPDSVAVRYDPTSRCLVVFTIDAGTDPGILRELVEHIKVETGIPHVFAFSNTDNHRLLVYQLTDAEEGAVRSIMEQQRAARLAAMGQIRTGLSAEALKVLDADQLHFEPWVKVRCESSANPDGFTLPLTGAYFPDDATWAAIGLRVPELIPISDPMAALTCVSGGKGANTHTLKRLSSEGSGFKVPETVVLTTLAFEEIALGDPQIRAEIAGLGQDPTPDGTLDPATQACAARIRERISQIRLPHDLTESIEAAFGGLGSDIAVRSSATSEDMQAHAAAGQAYTALHQIDVEGVFRSILDVWASLFSDGFVKYRNDIGFPNSQARMAVLLQAFVDPVAAGVVYSFDPPTERMGYRISAQPGVGEGVVASEGSTDSWFVGLLCEKNDILERDIPRKLSRRVADPSGGTKSESIDVTSPSLDDSAVLAVARAVQAVHRHYAANGIAEHVDVEYALDRSGSLYLVQTRPLASGATFNPAGRAVVRTTTVDVTQIPPGTRCVDLSGSCRIAVPGATTAILHIDPAGNASTCPPGSVYVVNHTNNDYNAIFASLAGVITTDGDPTGHAAEHAHEKRIPCVVGAVGALAALAPFNGQLVTFDAGRRRVYLGELPIVEEEHDLEVWLSKEAQIRQYADEGSRHENFREWSVSKAKRPRVFIEDFEGHFRRRSNVYCQFQLDYFYQAWDRVTETLAARFGDRTDRELLTQARLIKVVEAKHQLVHEVRDDDPESIYYYLMSVRDFGVADLEGMFEARLDGFRRFGAFVQDLDRIDGSNVEAVVDEILSVFVWMHFGFWLDSVVEDFAHRQLRYINSDGAFHSVLRDEAIADMDRSYRVAPWNPAIPAGKVLNLSRERDKEVFALLETVWEDPALLACFGSGSPAVTRGLLAERFPEVLAVIDGWSGKYKLTLEDLDLLSDTEQYIEDLAKRLDKSERSPRAGIMTTQLLTGIYLDYLTQHGPGEPDLAAMRAEDHNLYMLCRGYARGQIAQKRGVPLTAVASDEIDRALPDVIAVLEEADRDQRPLRNTAGWVLENYPDLKAVLRVSRMQFPLREDAHHLIVPLQRRLARLMLKAAEAFVPAVLSKPEDIFNIGIDELVALFKEPDPGFVALTMSRWPKYLAVERELRACWSVTREDFAGITPDVDRLWAHLSSEVVDMINQFGALQDRCRLIASSSQMGLGPEDRVFVTLRKPLANLGPGIAAFEACVQESVQVLETQHEAATLPRLKGAYRAEQERLLQRLENLKSRAAAGGRTEGDRIGGSHVH